MLCNTLALEQAKQSSGRCRVTQSPWRDLLALLEPGSDVSSFQAARCQALHNTVHQDARSRHEATDSPDMLKTTSNCCSSSSDSSSSSNNSSSSSSSSSRSSGQGAQSHRCGRNGASCSGRQPLEGNTVNDMMCITCQHSFTSQHSPFYVLPLALPTTRVCFCEHMHTFSVRAC